METGWQLSKVNAQRTKFIPVKVYGTLAEARAAEWELTKKGETTHVGRWEYNEEREDEADEMAVRRDVERSWR